MVLKIKKYNVKFIKMINKVKIQDINYYLKNIHYRTNLF